MTGKGNEYTCLRCGRNFLFCVEDVETGENEEVPVLCPVCGTKYVKKVFKFAKGYSSEPHC